MKQDLEGEAGFGGRGTVRDAAVVAALPDAIIGAPLGAARRHPDYAAAKAGNADAAFRLVMTLVDQPLLAQVRTAIGIGIGPVRILPVVSVEAAGPNAIPRAAAELLAARLGLATVAGIVQANAPMRTGLDGLDRLFAPVAFAGRATAGDYLLLDDTLTQGATFAALASHLAQQGGRVVAMVALTGKRYSAMMRAEQQTLAHLRQKHGDLEPRFLAATGYGFDALTQSEARYLGNFEPAQRLRDRLAAEGRRAGR